MDSALILKIVSWRNLTRFSVKRTPRVCRLYVSEILINPSYMCYSELKVKFVAIQYVPRGVVAVERMESKTVKFLLNYFFLILRMAKPRLASDCSTVYLECLSSGLSCGIHCSFVHKQKQGSMMHALRYLSCEMQQQVVWWTWQTFRGPYWLRYQGGLRKPPLYFSPAELHISPYTH
jgi:hypothetical protein